MESKEELTPGEALSFLVRLGQVNLEQIQRGDLLNLVDGLRRFLDLSGDGKSERELRAAESDPKRLLPTITVVRDVIETIADRKTKRISYSKGEYLIDATGQHPFSAEDATLRDNILHSVAADIDSEQASRIRRCPRCKEVFYGQPNAKFCSRRCAAADAVSRYRAGKKAKQSRERS